MRRVRRFNVLTGELPVEQDRPGYAWRARRGLADDFGLRWFGVSVYELPEGQWTYPYHYHHGWRSGCLWSRARRLHGGAW
jgi:uncharacterized cupin superfamily protein